MKILVPLDASQTAESAHPIAMRLAGEEKPSIVLVTVANVSAGEGAAPAEPQIAPVQDARSYLETAKSHLVAGTGEAVTAVWGGPVPAAIIKAAETYGVDMIVMTTRGRTSRQREMFGSGSDESPQS
jgi:nucleotide-binding universal stress UspA family protein